MALSDYLNGATLLVASNSDNAVLSYASGAWSQVSIPNALGVAASSPGHPLIVSGEGGLFVHHPVTGALMALRTGARYSEAVWESPGVLVTTTPIESLVSRYPSPLADPVDVWRPPGVDAAADDRSHVNGIAVVNGQARYASLLCLSNLPGGWRAGAVGGGAVYDITTSQSVVSGLTYPHTPRWDGTSLWVCDSGNGNLLKCDVATGAKTVAASLNAWCRGVAFASGHAFVGISQGRDSLASGLPIDAQASPGVAVVDLNTGQQVWFEPLDVFEIFDVQIGMVGLQ